MANSVELRALKRSERRGLESKVNNRMLRARVHRRVVAEVARSRPVIDVADRVGRRLRTACEWDQSVPAGRGPRRGAPATALAHAGDLPSAGPPCLRRPR